MYNQIAPNVTTLKTSVGKSMHGDWKAETRVPLDLKDGAERIISIVTMKRSGGALCTTASVHKIEGISMIFEMFGDFSQTLYNGGKVRCTEKSVTAQHSLQLLNVDALVEAVIAFYKEKAVKDAADAARYK